ncbi:PIN domain-containing protein [Myxozyma melibiosi]|uniref:PIN domain-containing protein n=1 Tax=Myxozyma melibiosi TaxID=54550 RepID=A0ABR1FAY1_9ASCO
MTSHSEPLYSDGDIEMKDLNDDEIEDIREAVEHTRAEAVHSGRKTLPEFQPPHSFEAADRNFEAAPILLVVDTNFAISHLKIIDELVALQGDFGYLIVVPTTVVRELDGLKKDNGPWSRTQSNKNSDVAVYARQAIRWLFRALAVSHPAVRPQRLDERHSDKDMAADDSILDCCWYFQKNRDKPVCLLSGDYNLCIKALANG